VEATAVAIEKISTEMMQSAYQDRRNGARPEVVRNNAIQKNDREEQQAMGLDGQAAASGGNRSARQLL
jgi:hypothetical protein